MAGGQKVGDAYYKQKASAKKRGIAWEISIAEWWKVWKESGKWSERGRGSGKFCMCRKGDQGPYKTENVSIGEYSQNCADGQQNKVRKYEEKMSRRALKLNHLS